MDTNASPGRFYAFTANTSATLPSSATLPDPQYRRGSSGSDSVSEDDGSVIQRSHPQQRPPPGYAEHHIPYSTQNPALFAPHRLSSAHPTVYVDDSPYVPPASSRVTHASGFVESGPDVPFNPSIEQYNPTYSSSVTPMTIPPTTFRRNSGDSSPTGSNGSGGSDNSGGVSGSSQGSASSGAVRNGSPTGGLVYQVRNVINPSQRVVPLSGFNPEHYPAYDEYHRRVGIEHARFGTDPPQADQAYYRPRTHTYPPVGAPQVPLGMDSPEPMQMSSFPSPELQLLTSMNSDEHPLDRDLHHDQLIPGQTRINLPTAPAPQGYDTYAYGGSSSSTLRSGDDVYIPTSDADIRRILGLSPDQELSLNALADPAPGQRPGQSIPTLSQLAILGSRNKRLTLQEIYLALENRFEWFRMNRDDKSWQNSIRHNLSLYKCFRRIAKPITEPGKGSYWVVDYSRGAGTKRPRKRNKRPTKAQLRAMAEEKATEQVVEQDSSPDIEDDEEFPSPAQSVQDIAVDLALQGYGHQVGQTRTRTSTRTMARRGNSPYAQTGQVSVQVRHARQGAIGVVATNMPAPRQPSATFGQPSFGQPSLGPAMFGQDSMDAARAAYPQSAWQTAMNQPNAGGQVFLPAPQPRTQSANMIPQPHSATHVRPSPTRANTLPMPSHMMQDMRGVQPFSQLAPLPGIEQFRDTGARFVARGVAPTQAHAGGPSQQFVQGSSRGGRRTSSSSGSSRE